MLEVERVHQLLATLKLNEMALGLERWLEKGASEQLPTITVLAGMLEEEVAARQIAT